VEYLLQHHELSEERAFAILDGGCTEGAGHACTELAFSYVAKANTLADVKARGRAREHATALFKRGCQFADPNACGMAKQAW
jgi:hypothetical protein